MACVQEVWPQQEEVVAGEDDIQAHPVDFGEDIGLEEDEEGGFLLLDPEQVDNAPAAAARPVLTAQQILWKQVPTMNATKLDPQSGRNIERAVLVHLEGRKGELGRISRTQ